MTLRVTLFDRFTIADDDGGVAVRLRPRSQRLLAYLILQRGRPVSRRLLAFTLWPDVTEDDALATLRRALNDLRTVVGSSGQPLVIATAGGDLRWDPERHPSADVLAFEQLVTQDTLTSLHAASDLYTGDLLPTWDDDWVVAERERQRERQFGVLRRLVEHHQAMGEFALALSLARRAVALDPLAEAAHRDLISLHYEAGDRAAALAAYERLRALLRDELDVEPMAETEALRAAIAAGTSSSNGDRLDVPARRLRAAGLMTQFVGRESELRHLVRLWESAAAGEGQLAIVSGEAGVGKSRLADALAGQVTAAGGAALVGHCYALVQALPYQPVIEMLRAAGPSLRHADLAPAFRAELARLVPDLFGVAESWTSVGEGVAIDPRSQLYEALLQAFVALARSRPLLLVIEDLHWAAESTIDWLAYVAQRLDDSRLLVVATYRTDEVTTTHALNRLSRRLTREGADSILVLDRLPETAIHELVAGESRLPSDLAGIIADRLYAETAGNPFFLSEIVRGLIEAGHIVVGPEHWEGSFVESSPGERLPLPDSLRGTLRSRVQRLTEMARVFSVAAAVTGQVFRYDIVREAGGWDDEAALDGLEHLLERGFVHETTTDGEYVFAHHLVREALYAELAAPRRTYWHGRVADAYVRAANRLPLAEQQELAGRIVHHAGIGGRTPLIFQWAPVAAARARRLSAYADALSLLETASDACERLRHDPEFDSEGFERQYIDILIDRSEIMPHVGRSVEEHGRVLGVVTELLARYPDERRQAAFELRHADYLSDNGQYDQAADAAIRASERCLALNDRRGAAQGFYQAGMSWMTIGKTRAAIRACEQALELFRAAGSATGEVLSLSAIGLAGIVLGRVEIAMQHLHRALELSEQRDDRLAMARVCYGLAFAWNYYYDPDKMRGFAERSLALYQQIGFAWTAWRPQLFIAVADGLVDDPAQVIATLEQIDERAHTIRDTWLEGWTAQLLGRYAFYQGELLQCESHLERALRIRQETGEVPHHVSDLAWIGRLRLAQGLPGDALAQTRRAIALLEPLRDEFWVWETPDVYYIHSQALTANDDHEAARRYLQRAYDSMMEFVAQTGDASVRQRFLAHHLNAQIVTAWEADRTADPRP